VEVDGVMLSHKDVAEAVSFGVPNEMYGQEIHAAVVLKANANVTENDLQKYIATKVAKFKVPKKVFISWAVTLFASDGDSLC
jgi:oxalate---CoA ligase